MAGIRYAHVENSLPDPFQDAPLLHLLLRGIKRSMGLSSRCRRLPITMALLRQLKDELRRAPDILPQDKLMLWSAFTIAFYGFLRSSEFTAPSTTQFNPLVHLCLTDVSFTTEGSLQLNLKSSKTDPYRQGCSRLIAPSISTFCLCYTSSSQVPLRLPWHWLHTSLRLQVRALSHQGKCHNSPPHPSPASRRPNRAICLA